MAFSRKRMPGAKVLTVDEVIVKLENFCAYRERCPKEVREKIRDLGLVGADAEQVYTVLETDSFFQEARFARSFASGKFRFNYWGRVRIRQELKMRDIAPEIILESLEGIDQEEYENTLLELIAKKLRQYEGDDNARDKTIASMVRAGFELGLVFKMLERSNFSKDY